MQTAADQPDGRTRLLDTAEELLDRHGLDGVSVRTITKESGHRNASAVAYHFGSLDQLVEAVLRRRQVVVQARRTALLQMVLARPNVTADDCLWAVIAPMGELLETTEGRRYLRLLFQGTNHPLYNGRPTLDFVATLSGLAPLVRQMVEHLPPDVQISRLRMALGMAVTALADQSRLVDDHHPQFPVLDRDTFMRELLVTLRAVLRAPAG